MSISEVLITNFGADASCENNAPTIQQAVDSLKSGGIVRIPAGVYCVGTVHLRSNQTLFWSRAPY